MSFNSSQDKITEDNSSNFNAMILQELYRIQDMVSSIDKKLHTTDNDAISILADKLSQVGTKSPETVFIESLISGIIKNPEALDKFAKYSVPPKK